MKVTLGTTLDPATGAATGPFTVDLASLTRHTMCVGMTGSGKTGLCMVTLEQILLAGVPVIAIDPKGDVANVALVPPDLSPGSFSPWVPGADAATRHAEGLAADGRGAEELRRFHERVAVTVLTPGSEAATPVDVVSSLTRAPASLRYDEEGLREYVIGCVSALLGLIGREGDPLTDPAAILLCRLFGDTFAAGDELPLDALIPAIVDPPFEHLGCMPVETFFPRPERLELAKDVNAIVASPAFAAWRRGVPLDVDAWLTPGPRTPVHVVYLAHLDDKQRMFFVTLLLHAVVAWSRRQPGTQDLRAMLYFDEVMGYLPPHPRTPPSKGAVLTLMKQARSVGLGVMLVTQNPVDVDYKAMSNAGLWLIGRLQTRQDRERVAAGIDGVAESVGALLPRSFLARTERGVALLRSRYAMSILRGPLTRAELARLGQRWQGDASADDGLLRAPPPLPGALTPRWLDVAGLKALGLKGPVDLSAPVWRPALYARFQVRLGEGDDVELRVVHRLRYPADPPPSAGIDEAPPAEIALQDAWLHRRPPLTGRYHMAPACLPDDAEVAALRDRWSGHVAREERSAGPEQALPRRSDVEPLGLVLVWVPGPAS